MIDAKLFPYEGDLLVANAARGSFGVAYDTWSDEPRGPRARGDRQLLQDLSAGAHELPFRHAHVSLRCIAPVPIARQLGKHQVGFSWSEISRRYRIKDITFHRVGSAWRAAPAERRQGSGELLPMHLQERLSSIQERNILGCIADYEEALTIGAAPEQARFLLPQSMEVIWVWTGSLLGWADLYLKRSHPDTQAETRWFVQEMSVLMAAKHPVGWNSLVTGGQF